jgi:hypothetical protein
VNARGGRGNTNNRYSPAASLRVGVAARQTPRRGCEKISWWLGRTADLSRAIGKL